MPRKAITVRPEARDALAVLGMQIRAARLARNWSVADTAARVGVSPATMSSIETGAPGTAIGSVFHAAALLGVPLFGIEDPGELARLRKMGERDMGLLRRRASGPARGVTSKDGADDGYPF